MEEEHNVRWEDIEAYLEENKDKMSKEDWERVANDIGKLSFEDTQKAQLYLSTFSEEYVEKVRQQQLKEIAIFSEDYISAIREKQLEEEKYYAENQRK
jgi:hypothetical protein